MASVAGNSAEALSNHSDSAGGMMDAGSWSPRNGIAADCNYCRNCIDPADGQERSHRTAAAAAADRVAEDPSHVARSDA